MTVQEAKQYYSNKFSKECHTFREDSRWFRVTRGFEEQLDEINQKGSGWLFYYEDVGEKYPDLKKEFISLSAGSRC